MCLSCWDADEKKTILLTESCDGTLTPFMTVEELKAKIIKKWHYTKKTSHFVYKDAIINPPSQELEWVEVLNNSKTLLKVRLV